MQKNEGSLGQGLIRRGSRWQEKLRRPDCGQAQRFEGAQIATHGMFAGRHGRHVLIKPARAFAGVGQANGAGRTADSGHERAAQQSLEIEGHIGADFPQSQGPGDGAQSAGRAAEFLSRKNDRLSNGGVARQQGFPAFVDQPGDFCFRPESFDRGGAGQGVNDVAE